MIAMLLVPNQIVHKFIQKVYKLNFNLVKGLYKINFNLGKGLYEIMSIILGKYLYTASSLQKCASLSSTSPVMVQRVAIGWCW